MEGYTFFKSLEKLYYEGILKKYMSEESIVTLIVGLFGGGVLLELIRRLFFRPSDLAREDYLALQKENIELRKQYKLDADRQSEEFKMELQKVREDSQKNLSNMEEKFNVNSEKFETKLNQEIKSREILQVKYNELFTKNAVLESKYELMVQSHNELKEENIKLKEQINSMIKPVQKS